MGKAVWGVMCGDEYENGIPVRSRCRYPFCRSRTFTQMAHGSRCRWAMVMDMHSTV